MKKSEANLEILKALPANTYLQGDDVSDRYANDWSGGVPTRPPVVLRPSSTAQVATMLAACDAVAQPLVVQGGLTGLSGGAIPQAGEWALSLERLQEIHALDPVGQTLHVGAGLSLQAIHQQAAQFDLRLPLDLGARGSCMAGGLVSTNAGGNQVVQFGMTRALVLGLTAVLADGTIIAANNQLLKNNAGYDLKQLFIGSEGTLGVVTEVVFRLFPEKPHKASAFCGLQTFADVVALLDIVNRGVASLSAFEVMWDFFVAESLGATKLSSPLASSYPYYVLVESEGIDAASTDDEFQRALMLAMERGLVRDAAIASSENSRAQFWSIRDGIAELLSTYAPAANLDVGISITSMEAFASALSDRLDQRFPDHRTLIFGHVADGNLHVISTTGNAGDVEAISGLTYELIGQFDGTITAEHGVGRAKKDYLQQSRTPAEIALMRTLKQALDPRSILNPGRIF